TRPLRRTGGPSDHSTVENKISSNTRLLREHENEKTVKDVVRRLRQLGCAIASWPSLPLDLSKDQTSPSPFDPINRANTTSAGKSFLQHAPGTARRLPWRRMPIRLGNAGTGTQRREPPGGTTR
ncbi:unnamed protein product, partial [Ectocarpus sp. 13 AM-2016]